MMRIIIYVYGTAEKLDILAGTAGIAFHPGKLRSKSCSIAYIDELYSQMTVFAETEKSAFRTEK